MTSLQEAVDFLHDKVVVQGKSTSTARMDGFEEYCKEQMSERGVSPWVGDRTLDAWARDKEWDVVHPPEGRPHICITMKSILRNLSGTIPNRTDDLIGETADLQMRYPEVAIGYLVVVETSDSEEESDRDELADELERRLDSVGGRCPPYWGTGSVEATCTIKADIDDPDGPTVHTPESEIEEFFDELVSHHRDRFGGQQQL